VMNNDPFSHLCYRHITGKSERNNPDALSYSPRFRAYPCEGYIPRCLETQRQNQTAVRIVIARQFQHEIGVIRSAYAAIKDRGVPEEEANRLREQVDFTSLKRLKADLPKVFAEAIAIRKDSLSLYKLFFSLGVSRGIFLFLKVVELHPLSVHSRAVVRSDCSTITA